jgi:hypothetical protein
MCSLPLPLLRIRLITLVLLVLGAAAWLHAEDLASHSPPPALDSFLRTNCYDCHQGADAEAGFDVARLGVDLTDAAVQKQWVRLFDRVQQGEMPPADGQALEPEAKATFLNAAGDWLRLHQLAENAQFGRVRARRLTRREIERSLHDLLGIDIPLADQLPEESRSAGFTTVADGQAMSHFLLERHLAVVDVALDEAFRRALSPPDKYEQHLDAREVARRDPRRRTREPEMREDQAVVWSSGLIFYGRIPATTAPEDGWYRFRVRVAGLKLPASGGVWTTVRSGLCVSSAPLLAYITAFEATEEPREIEFDAWLPRRHMLEIRPGDTTLKRARFAGGQVGAGEGEPQNVPGIAIERITIERIHQGADDDRLRRLLFGDLAAQADAQGQRFTPQSVSPREDAVRLLERFARRAFRRPVTKEQLAGCAEFALTALDEGKDLAEALRLGYRAILCSPRFLYLTETPGALDDYAIAARLSYLLTGSIPDARLTELADAGRLRDAATLRSETDRLLAGRGGLRFLEDFAAQWLDLDQIDFTQPDTKLFPDFDAIVQNSMLDETHTYLETMLRENASVARLMDSDFTFLNSRLARFYGIGGVEGDALRRVTLLPQHHRGGLLTQGAVLKVTANGTNTSPVIRGVWVSERLLGETIPPPPDNVPAIEPDIRGATTIREMLAKHRSQPSCASCHVKIDPPGFALENFSPAGQWRDRYVQLIDGRRETGAEVDASYALPDGREFSGVDEFRRLTAAEPQRLARSVAQKLLIYGTGAPISFADRQAVDDLVAQAKQHDYGLRSIIHAVVTSPTFLSK